MENKPANQGENLLNNLLILTYGKEHDLLTAKPIILQVKDYGETNVSNIIKAWLLKLSEAIGDNLTENVSRLSTLADDLIDLYHYDSLEDIRECLKKGRRGQYGFGHHKRGYITMLLLREWMTNHLDEKCAIREKEIAANKIQLKEVENFDPKEFYKNGKQYFEEAKEREKKRNSFNSNAYDRIKNDYFEDKEL
jgi:hypothetical protein